MSRFLFIIGFIFAGLNDKEDHGHTFSDLHRMARAEWDGEFPNGDHMPDIEDVREGRF